MMTHRKSYIRYYYPERVRIEQGFNAFIVCERESRAERMVTVLAFQFVFRSIERSPFRVQKYTYFLIGWQVAKSFWS